MEENKDIIIITGSSGRIGSRLTERLHERYRVVGFDRRPGNCALHVADCVTVDLADETRVQEALAYVRECYGNRIASVVHLAAYYDFSGQRHPLYDEVNVRGTWRLVRGLRDFKVEQFLFASTMMVHAPTEPGERIHETSPFTTNRDWGYPRSKLEAERLLLSHRGDMPLVVARIASVYDEFCRHPVLARHFQRIYERQLSGHFFAGNPLHGMTYLQQEDLVEALVRVIDRRNDLPRETILLLGEDEPVSYQEIQEEVSRLLLGREEEVQIIPPAVARAGAWIQEHLPTSRETFIKPWMIDHADDHYELDCRRARTLLDWAPQFRLPAMLPNMVSVLMHDPLRWYDENELDPPASLVEEKQAA